MYHAVLEGLVRTGHSKARSFPSGLALRPAAAKWLRSKGAAAVRVHDGYTLGEYLALDGMTVRDVAARTSRSGT